MISAKVYSLTRTNCVKIFDSANSTLAGKDDRRTALVIPTTKIASEQPEPGITNPATNPYVVNFFRTRPATQPLQSGFLHDCSYLRPGIDTAAPYTPAPV